MKILLGVWCCWLVGLAGLARGQEMSISPPKKPPFLGMTKAQALARYGEPWHHSAGPQGGEQWFYHLKFSEVYGRAFVPFWYSSENVNLGVITFGPKGTVTRYHWNRPGVE